MYPTTPSTKMIAVAVSNPSITQVREEFDIRTDCWRWVEDTPETKIHECTPRPITSALLWAPKCNLPPSSICFPSRQILLHIVWCLPHHRLLLWLLWLLVDERHCYLLASGPCSQKSQSHLWESMTITPSSSFTDTKAMDTSLDTFWMLSWVLAITLMLHWIWSQKAVFIKLTVIETVETTQTPFCNSMTLRH